MEFADRDEAKLWIIRNQFGRRNLDKWQRFDLAKSREEIEKLKAKERQASTQFGGEGNISLTKGQTRDVMGEKVGVSGKTYDKMKAIDESNHYAQPRIRRF